MTLDNSVTPLSQFPQNGDASDLIWVKHLVLCLARKRHRACTFVHSMELPSWEVGEFVPFYVQEGAEVQRGEVTCLKQHSWQREEEGWNFSLLYFAVTAS